MCIACCTSAELLMLKQKLANMSGLLQSALALFVRGMSTTCAARLRRKAPAEHHLHLLQLLAFDARLMAKRLQLLHSLSG